MAVVHRPVMVAEAMRYLACRPGGVYVDGTLGGAGHALAILGESAPDGTVIGLDVDGEAIERASSLLAPYGRRAVVLRENYRDIKAVLQRLGIGAVDGVLLDVGVSSYQLEGAERGFGFKTDSRLDMRMDRRQETSAYELVNGLPEKELYRVIRTYGEERRAGRIARAIVRAREKAPVRTTGELASIVRGCVPPGERHGRVHPATRTFQALRIEVNGELESLEKGLMDGVDALKAGGRMVVISFHSLEDRIVKNGFAGLSKGCVCPPDLPVCACNKRPVVRRITRKVCRPSAAEAAGNPRARSARLRAIERC